MGKSIGQLLQNVLAEGNFDASESQALDWLNARHELMVVRSKCFRERIPVAFTVAGQQAYPVPARVLELRELTVQAATSVGGLGVPYGAGRHVDLAQGALGYLWLGGIYLAVGGGLYVRDDNAAGETQVAIYPTPTEAGRLVEIYATCRAEPLSLTPTGLIVGNPATFRFCFTTRNLTVVELAAFIATGVLPAGIGYDPPVVKAEYTAPGSAPTMLEGATIVRDAVGAYHFVRTPLVVGMIQWKGLGYTGAELTAATPVEEAEVGTGGSQIKVPSEFEDALVAGAIATGLRRLEQQPGAAASFEQEFAGACTELTQQTNKRFRGSGPARVRVLGWNA